MADMVLGSLVWGFIAYSVFRGYRQAQQVDRYMFITWTIFVSFGVVFTLRISAVQPFVDAYFYGYPVTFLVSLLAVLAAVGAYSLSLKWLVQRSPEVYRLRWFHPRLIQVAPVVACLLVGVMAAHIAGYVTSFQTQYLMKWLVEGYGFLQSALVFVPVNFAMLRREKVFPMRIKHLATLVLTATFALSAACSVLFIPPMILTETPYEGNYFVPRVPISFICLIIILVPHCWLTVLRQPALLRCLTRLAVLERRIGRMVDIRREPLSLQQVINPKRTEMAIYIKAINILDNYPRVDLSDPRGCELVAQIDALLPRCPGYDEMVKGLCRIRL